MFERFWRLACQFTPVFLVVLATVTTLFVLSAAAYPFLEPGSSSQAISQINLIVLGALAALSGFMYWRCRGYRPPPESET